MSIDLNAILQPVVDAIRDLYFPNTVHIQTRTDAQDATGQLTPSYSTLEADVPALIEPVQVSQGTEGVGQVIVVEDHVRILFSDEHTVPMDGRVLVVTGPGAGEAWDVAAEQNDPVGVTTQVIGRRATPGAPT